MRKRVSSFTKWFILGAMFAASMFIAPKQSDAYAIAGLGARTGWDALVGISTVTDADGYLLNQVYEVDIAGQVPDGGTLGAGTALDLLIGDMTFNQTLTGLQVPGSWGTWSGGETPAVLYTSTGTLHADFSEVQTGFGFEMEPNAFSSYLMTLTLFGGSTHTLAVNGDSGATFFGWVDEAVIAMDISCASCGTDPTYPGFAIGRMVQQVPEPATLILLGAGMTGLALMRRRVS